MSQCLACLVGETAGQRKTLETLALRTGFVSISMDESGAGFPDRVDRRTAFFFFHCQVGEELLGGTLHRIRTNDQLLFDPAILVVGECSEREVVRYINLGFDDIVVLPEAARVLERRFTNQLGAPISYFETATYFGPDRRRSSRLPTAPSHAERPSNEHRHVRYLIQRLPSAVEILRREVVISNALSAPPPASATVSFA